MGKCNVILGFVARAAVVGSLVATVSAPAVVGASSSRGLSHSTRAVPAAAPDATQLSGTVTNTDRMVQLGRKAIPAPGEAKPDLWIIQELARRMVLVHVLHLLLSGASMVLLATRGLPGMLWIAWTLLLYARALMPYRPIPARTLGWREGGLSAVALVLLWRALV